MFREVQTTRSNAAPIGALFERHHIAGSEHERGLRSRVKIPTGGVPHPAVVVVIRGQPEWNSPAQRSRSVRFVVREIRFTGTDVAQPNVFGVIHRLVQQAGDVIVVQRVGDAASVALGGDQAHRAEQAQLVGDRRLFHADGFGELADGGRRLPQLRQDHQSAGCRQGLQGRGDGRGAGDGQPRRWRLAPTRPVQEGVAELPLAAITNPATGGPGVRVRFLRKGRELFAENRRATALVRFGGDIPIADSDTLELSTRYVPEISGPIVLGFAAVGMARIFVDGRLRHEGTVVPVGTDLGAAFLSPPSSSFRLEVTAGTPVDIRIEYDIAKPGGAMANALSFTFGLEPDNADPDALIAHAAAAAQAADVAIVVVGTNSKVESEGYDRNSLDLPGRQDDLVRAVLAANPQTVVVVNSGAPVVLPWREQVAAILLTWLGGQEYGNALADVLLGAREPGGRLPTSWPATQADVPVLEVTPIDGDVRYDEGVHIGYRAWLKEGTAPAWLFGYGLGYTSWSLRSLQIDRSISEGDRLPVRVQASNTGQRPGKCVIQVYASRGDSAVDRPVRWLVGFAVVHAAGGEAVDTTIDISARAFAFWDNEWRDELGRFELAVGTSVSELPLTGSFELR